MLPIVLILKGMRDDVVNLELDVIAYDRCLCRVYLIIGVFYLLDYLFPFSIFPILCLHTSCSAHWNEDGVERTGRAISALIAAVGTFLSVVLLACHC